MVGVICLICFCHNPSNNLLEFDEINLKIWFKTAVESESGKKCPTPKKKYTIYFIIYALYLGKTNFKYQFTLTGFKILSCLAAIYIL